MKSILFTCWLSLGLMACQQPSSNHQNQVASTAQSADVYANLALTSDQIIPPKIEYTPNPKPQTVYFSANGEPSDKPVANGFYRQILGTTSDGRSVVQDYYADTKKQQTTPFVIKKGSNPTEFSKHILDSRVIWYSHHDGEIASVGNFRNGVQQDWLDVYEYKQLVVQLKDNSTGIAMRFFSPDDKIWGESEIVQGKKGLEIKQLKFYHPNGKIMSQMDIDPNGKPIGMTTFDENGKKLDDKQNATFNQILLARFGVVVHKLPTLMARTNAS